MTDREVAKRPLHPVAGRRTRRAVGPALLIGLVLAGALVLGVVLLVMRASSAGDGADPVADADVGSADVGSADGGSVGGGSAGGSGCGSTDGAGRGDLEGFGEVAVRVEGPGSATAFEGCALLAATPEARAQGLMGQTDLLGYDAMVFRFDAPSTGAFYMFHTVMPLSIAYLDADGAVVSTADMDPCLEEAASACPTYPAAGPFLHAVEVPQGDLDRLGIGPGATVTFGAEVDRSET